MRPRMSVSSVARQSGASPSPSQLFAWKRRVLEGVHASVQADEDVVGTSRVRDREKRVRDLERLLGRKTMENEILRRRSTSLAQKNGHRPCYLGAIRRTVNAVARTLGVARSHINERRGRAVKPRGRIAGSRMPSSWRRSAASYPSRALWECQRLAMSRHCTEVSTAAFCTKASRFWCLSGVEGTPRRFHLLSVGGDPIHQPLQGWQ